MFYLANLCSALCFWCVLCLEMCSLGELVWLGEYFSYLFYKMQKCTGTCNNMHNLLALNMYCILAPKTINIFQLPPKKKKKNSMLSLQRVLSHDCLHRWWGLFLCPEELISLNIFCTSSILQEIKYCFCFPNTLEKTSLLISAAKTAHERNAVHFLTKI